jgi:protein-disulfide isomerase
MRIRSYLVATACVALAAACQPNQPTERQTPTVDSPATTAEGTSGHQWPENDPWNHAASPVKGSETAIVTIVEFSEFQCPFCSRVNPTLQQLLADEEFSGKVRVVFKHLPLGFHDRARPAGIASMAAHRQGKFWEFHDLAFQNQRDLTDANFLAWAEQIGLDMDRFRADLADPAVAAQVDADNALATQLGIQGTPNFLINGTPLTGAQPYDAFAAAVRAEIAATQALIDGGQTAPQAYLARITANEGARTAANAPREAPPARPEPDPNAELYVPIAGSATKGGAEALVTVVVFSEFQCPFCARVNPTIQQVLETYGDDVRIVFRHLPLGFHDRAMPAAQAAVAAQNQGKFWEFHDLLFDNQRDLSDEAFIRHATALGMDLDRFRADMASPETQARIAADMADSERLVAQGTPHFFVNGKRLVGAQPFEAFRAAIDRELEVARAAVAGGASRATIYDTLQEDAIRGAVPMIQPPGGAAQPQRQARPQPDPNAMMYVPVEGSPTKGPDDALVTIVEFSEFQCPFCSRVGPTLQQIQERYGNDVRIVFKHLPLDFHDRAIPAARASIAAHRQGKFWDFHDLLFANMSDLTDEAFVRHATALGLDLDRFRADINAPETQAQIDADTTLARRLAAGGTPHFFINGYRLRGAQPFENFQQIIDRELEVARTALSNGANRARIYDVLQENAIRGEAPMITP